MILHKFERFRLIVPVFVDLEYWNVWIAICSHSDELQAQICCDEQLEENGDEPAAKSIKSLLSGKVEAYCRPKLVTTFYLVNYSHLSILFLQWII